MTAYTSKSTLLSSLGIAAAPVSSQVIQRAREKLVTLEQRDVEEQRQMPLSQTAAPQQNDLFASAPHPVVEALENADVGEFNACQTRLRS